MRSGPMNASLTGIIKQLVFSAQTESSDCARVGIATVALTNNKITRKIDK
jgi:hypothetical protein